MSTKLIYFWIFMLLFTVACDEKKKEITQEHCERQTNRADCEAAGCTYTCGMIFLKVLPDSSSDCVARRNVGRCLAVVKFVGKDDHTNNGDIDYLMGPNETGWHTDIYTRYGFENNSNYSYRSMFRLKNPFPYTVEVLGHHFSFWGGIPDDQDPCYQLDPDGAPSILWEGSCETDWWSEDLWDDVLAE